ncbi:family 43 glycosylhydrolase [Streptomyces sp. NPDC047917]|uniref:family 43 glycosylhydrolase n=1 Tax=Streptomyces sp. NPDC047917 TaxID=3365491 RepID=UPI0037178D28
MNHTATGAIEPGRLFHDQHGRTAQLHGIGILRLGDRFWAWGEDKRHGGTFAAIACYSSPDLATWRYEGDSLTAGTGDLAPDRVVERPKVLHHAATGRYVMFLHIDSADYTDARVGFAVGDRPAGPYEYRGSARPLGRLSRDIGVHTEDGAGYLLSEDRDHGLHIYRLTDDYFAVDSLVSTTLADHGRHGYESPALVRVDGTYYLFGSDLTGWTTNDNRYTTAPALTGPWEPWRLFAPEGSATHDSQISAIATVHGTERTSHVYLGDRWLPDRLADSPPVWLPLHIGGGRAHLEWSGRWSIDTTTGNISGQDGPARPHRSTAT